MNELTDLQLSTILQVSLHIVQVGLVGYIWQCHIKPMRAEIKKLKENPFPWIKEPSKNGHTSHSC